MSRRNFLTVSGAVLALPGFLPVQAQASSRSEILVKNKDVSLKLNAECGVYRDGQLLACLNMSGLESVFSSESKVVQYILNFKAKTPVHLAESSYRVLHPELGGLDLFLQPCGDFTPGLHDGVHYRACTTFLR